MCISSFQKTKDSPNLQVGRMELIPSILVGPSVVVGGSPGPFGCSSILYHYIYQYVYNIYIYIYICIYIYYIFYQESSNMCLSNKIISS